MRKGFKSREAIEYAEGINIPSEVRDFLGDGPFHVKEVCGDQISLMGFPGHFFPARLFQHYKFNKIPPEAYVGGIIPKDKGIPGGSS